MSDEKEFTENFIIAQHEYEISLSQKDRRGLYAAMAMQGILANESRSAYQKTIVDCAIEYADELIKKLEE